MQQLLKLARKAADDHCHRYVGTEHLLLGLLDLEEGVGFCALNRLEVDLPRLRGDLERSMTVGSKQERLPMIPYMPVAKQVLRKYGYREAKGLGNGYFGTEHLLLGLLAGKSGLGYKALKNQAVELLAARKAVQECVAPDPAANAELGPKGDDPITAPPTVKIVLEGVGEFSAADFEQKWISDFLSKFPALSQKDCLAYLYLSRCLRFARDSAYGASLEIKHVSAPELLLVGRAAAMSVFGENAREWLIALGISSSRSFGDCVFHLVKLGLLTARENDKLEDFHVTSDLDDFLRPDASSDSVQSP